MSAKRRFVYGTSGFRADADLLVPVIRRTAFFASVRSAKLKRPIGMMITASHNPVGDNGVKLIDPNGGMLPIECELELTEIVNASDEDFGAMIQQFGPILGHLVLIGTDTRPSSPLLLQEAVDQIMAVVNDGSPGVQKYERITTPLLHSIVARISADFDDNSKSVNFDSIDTILSSYHSAFARSLKAMPYSNNHSRYTKELFVDCANGVGALWVSKYFGIQSTSQLHLNLINIDTSSESQLLNHQCGADFVKIQSQLPANFDSVPHGARCASLDGDADRLVYFYPAEDGKVVLLDGDHIAALFARFIAEQFSAAKSSGQEIPLTFGIVQTAYANGNSTRYFSEKLGIQPVMTKTGVKHLEEAAHKFDVGIYFEANGHGTVCFSSKFDDFMENWKKSGKEIPKCLDRLFTFSGLVNKLVGDGIADLLAVECLLRHYDWTVQDWLEQTYTDMPNVQKKVEVVDKAKYVVAEDRETVLIRPEGIQTRIDEIVGQFDRARAFIRPSGTEQIVRIYAEAQMKEQADELAERLVELVRTLTESVSTLPQHEDEEENEEEWELERARKQRLPDEEFYAALRSLRQRKDLLPLPANVSNASEEGPSKKDDDENKD